MKIENGSSVLSNDQIHGEQTSPRKTIDKVMLSYSEDNQEKREIIDVKSHRFVEVISNYDAKVTPVPANMSAEAGVVMRVLHLVTGVGKKHSPVDVPYTFEDKHIRIVGFSETEISGTKVRATNTDSGDMMLAINVGQFVPKTSVERRTMKTLIDNVTKVNMALLREKNREIPEETTTEEDTEKETD